MNACETYLTWATVAALFICAVAFAAALVTSGGLGEFLGAVL